MVLAAHLPPLRLLRFGEESVDILDVAERLGEVVFSPDCFEPHCFCVQIANYGLNAWELVYVVNCLAWRGAVAHGLDVFHCVNSRDAV